MPFTLGLGLLGGFNQAASEERKAIREQQGQRDERELSLLAQLAQSPDQQTQELAIAGLLNFADPRKKRKGLSGFLGETEGHPALPAIRQLLGTMAPGTSGPSGAGQGAGPAGGGAITTTPGAAPAAQPSTSPTTGGGSGIPQVLGMPGPPPSGPAGPPPPMRRELLPSLETKTRQQARGKAQGDTEGDFYGFKAVGYSDEEAMEMTRQAQLKRSGAAPSVAEGNVIPDQASPTGFSQILYDHQTGQERGRTPAMDPQRATLTAEGNVVPDPRTPGQFVQEIYDRRTGQVIGHIAAMDPTKTASAGAGLATVVNPLDGTVTVVNKAGVMAGDPNAARQVGAPQGPTGSAPAPAAAGGPPPAGPQALNVGGIAERQQAREDATLLSPEDNRKYGTPSGTTKGDIRRQGLMPHSEQELQAIDDVDRALQILPRIKALTFKLFGGTVGKAGAAVPFVGQAAERITQEINLTSLMNSPEYAELDGLIARAKPGAARISGNRGNLSEQEREQAGKSFPQLGEGAFNLPDTAAMAIGRLTALERDLQSTRAIFARGAEPAGGGGTPGATPPPSMNAQPTSAPAPAGPPPAAPKQFVQDQDGVWVVENTLPNGQYELREATPAELSAYYAKRGTPPAAKKPGGR